MTIKEVMLTNCPACGQIQVTDPSRIKKCVNCGSYYDWDIFSKFITKMDDFVFEALTTTVGG